MDLLFNAYGKYKLPGRVWVAHELYVALKNPEHIKIVLNSPNSLAKGDLYRFLKPIVGEGLFSAPGIKKKSHPTEKKSNKSCFQSTNGDATAN